MLLLLHGRLRAESFFLQTKSVFFPRTQTQHPSNLTSLHMQVGILALPWLFGRELTSVAKTVEPCRL